jgi:hypothetical protein
MVNGSKHKLLPNNPLCELLVENFAMISTSISIGSHYFSGAWVGRNAALLDVLIEVRC